MIDVGQQAAFQHVNWEVIKLAPVRFRSRSFVTGFPGAGNVLAATICRRLYEVTKTPDMLEDAGEGVRVNELMQSILVEFSSRLDGLLLILREALPPSAESYLQHDRMGTSNFFATIDKDFIIIKSLDVGAYFNSRIHSNHELPTHETFKFYRSKGFKTVLCVRHPLGIIASFAAKGFDRKDTAIANEAKRLGVSVAQLAMATRLSSPTWIARTARLLKQFYDSVPEQTDAFSIIHFEKGLHGPTQYVENLAKLLSLSVPNEAICSIATVIGASPLAPNHFNSPSIDSWKRRFVPADLDAVSASGLFSTFQRFGYEPPTFSDFENLSDDQMRLRELFGKQTSRMDLAAEFDFDYRALAGTFEAAKLAIALGAAGKIIIGSVGEREIVGSDQRMMSEYASRLSVAAASFLRTK